MASSSTSKVEGPLPKSAAPHAHAIVRPLLDIPRGKLLEYAQQHSLQWVEDESNADERYPRNFLRHRLLPLMEQQFPAYRHTLSRSAQHFAEASGLLDELAQQDAHGLLDEATLEISSLRELSYPRGKNLLRYWLHSQGAPMPQAAQLDEMMEQLLDARADAALCVHYGGWQVRRYQGKVYLQQTLGEFDRNLVLRWQGEPELDWPALQICLNFKQVHGRGLSLQKLRQAPVTVRLRSGGETLRPHATAAKRSLKNLLQEQHIPPWRRERLPLLYCGESLVAVVGVAIAADFQAADSEPGLVVA